MPRKSALRESRRVPLPRISEETRQIAVFLERELLSWPGVNAKPMFGMMALYRGSEIFAAVPRTRGMETAWSVSFKLVSPSPLQQKRLAGDPRVVRTKSAMEKWISFEVKSPRDVPDALRWFERAYREAGLRDK